MLVEGGAREANLDRARNRIREAADAGCRLIVLPEAMDLGWTHPSARARAGAIPGGRSFELLSAEARRNKIYVCAGLVERSDRKVFNSAVLISPDGALLLKHRKINELDIAWPYYEAGSSIRVCRTSIGVVGIMICADAFARDRYVGRTLGHLGAEIVLSPSSWAVNAAYDQEAEPYGDLWRDAYRPVSIEHKMWILAVSNVGPLSDGPWKGKKCIGCSLAFDSSGREVLYGPYGELADRLLIVETRITEKGRVFSEANERSSRPS